MFLAFTSRGTYRTASNNASIHDTSCLLMIPEGRWFPKQSPALGSQFRCCWSFPALMPCAAKPPRNLNLRPEIQGGKVLGWSDLCEIREHPCAVCAPKIETPCRPVSHTLLNTDPKLQTLDLRRPGTPVLLQPCAGACSSEAPHARSAAAKVVTSGLRRLMLAHLD